MKMEQLKGDIQHRRELTKDFVDLESAALEEGNDSMGWKYYDSPVEKFDDRFNEVLPGGLLSLSEYIEEFYTNRKGELIGMELGGPGINLFEGLSPDYFKKTVGVTLVVPEKSNTVSEKHTILKADVFHKAHDRDSGLPGFQEVENFTKKNGKADILIENMIGGNVGDNPDLFIMYLLRWYKLLNEEGTMFISSSPMGIRSRILCQSKINLFLGSLNKFVDFQFESNIDIDFFLPIAQTLRLRKLKGAPDNLDMLVRNYNQGIKPDDVQSE